MEGKGAEEAADCHPRLRIGDKVFDLNTATLADQFSQVIPIRDQSLRVLLELALNTGQIVSKHDLITAVWPDIAVTDDSLVQCIKDIRAALGDVDRTLVKTAVGRGYSLCSDLDVPVNPIARPRLLISKLRSTQGDLEASEIAEEIGEELAIFLSHRSGLEITTDAGHRSDAQYLISGRVGKRGSDYRVFIQLESLDNGTSIFAESWDYSSEDISDLPAQVSAKITHLLRIHTIMFGGKHFANRPNAELAPQALLSKAAFHMCRFEIPHWVEARAALEAAVKLEPENPIALAMLASMATQLTPQVAFRSLPDDIEHVFKLANRAVELGSNIDFVLRTRGNLRMWLRGDHEGARSDCERALGISPTFHLAHLTIATSDILAGHPTEGISRLNEINLMGPKDPQYPNYMSLISIGQMLLKSSDKAFAAALEGHEYNPSDSWSALVYAASAAGRTNITDTPQFQSLLARIDLPFSHFRDMPFSNSKDVDLLEERLRSVGFASA
ncbi:Transcriptional regulatory protein, C terminal [Jannaschia faecimaris]|uniref:Transcriptional regulatory protein, C terminal n=1 Tax=Jannaschia faecimaris TaxID=1244108 RepID=A0A1H3U4D0_9RHOB|nr:winged helix-turn-helix domain-containing protein [Jannaschia faecimaris]SDZ57310.1 Transcriptional regulatory protein, C terminal [Jannaschia faecimaris]